MTSSCDFNDVYDFGMLASLYYRFIVELKSDAPPTSDRDEALIDFITTPYHAEKVLSFGTCLALDSFLHTLTIMPLRACYKLCRRQWCGEIVQVAVIGLSFRFLQGINTSRVYHAIRGQGGITIFVLYSLMEVCDKFLCSVGHEIAACLTSEQTLASPKRTVIYTMVNLIYTILHSFVLMWQLVTLNLAVNSYSNALLSFMLTNQFGEIRSAVFKRFNKNSLFQMTCADITQRFQFASLLLVIVLRNLLEVLSKGEPLFTQDSLSKSCGPASIIMLTIIVVDWLKIAYIAKFNDLSSKVLFGEYLELLKLDYASNNSQRGQQSLVSKQTGLPVAPLVIVCVRMLAKGGVILSPVTPSLFIALFVLHLYINSWLYRYTGPTRKLGKLMEKRRDRKERKRLNRLNRLKSGD